MKTISLRSQTFGALLCSMICLPACSQGPSAELVSYKPSWTVGQTWQVDVEGRTQAPGDYPRAKRFVPQKVVFGYVLEVEARKEIEGETCYQVRAQCISIDGKRIERSPRDYGRFFRFFLRADDGTLKMLQTFSVLGDQVTLESSQSFPRGPVQATETTTRLTADFPIFSLEARKYAPSKSTEPNAITPHAWILSQQKYESSKDTWIVNETEKSALNITLRYERPGDEAGPQITEQVWVKGMPWPLRSVYKYGHMAPLEAKLVRVGDSSIVSSTRAQNQK